MHPFSGKRRPAAGRIEFAASWLGGNGTPFAGASGREGDPYACLQPFPVLSGRRLSPSPPPGCNITPEVLGHMLVETANKLWQMCRTKKCTEGETLLSFKSSRRDTHPSGRTWRPRRLYAMTPVVFSSSKPIASAIAPTRTHSHSTQTAFASRVSRSKEQSAIEEADAPFASVLKEHPVVEARVASETEANFITLRRRRGDIVSRAQQRRGQYGREISWNTRMTMRLFRLWERLLHRLFDPASSRARRFLTGFSIHR